MTFYSCRKQIVSFIVSCLSDSEIFGAYSADSVVDFIRYIGTDLQPTNTYSLLRLIADDLDIQNMMNTVRNFCLCNFYILILDYQQISTVIFQHCYGILNGQPIATQHIPVNFSGFVSPISALDDVSPIVTAVMVLILADKR